MTAALIEAAGSVPRRARAIAAGQVCTAGALLVTAPSGRLTELDAWWAGWFTLLVISVPALFLWSDL